MILGLDIVKKLGLIENLCERELDNPEGCGLDVRIGKLWEAVDDSDGFLHIDQRKTPDYKLAAEYKSGETVRFKLQPGKIYVAETIEKMNTPLNIFGRFHPRHTLYKSGVLVFGQKSDPGYRGAFTFVLIPLRPFQIEMGARVAQMVWHEVKGRAEQYRGQWQGGRAWIERPEQQV